MIADSDWIFEGELETVETTQLGENFLISLIKLQQINEIYDSLPKIDCCVCDSPSCRALAEDIVGGLKQFNDCVVLNQAKRGEIVDGE